MFVGIGINLVRGGASSSPASLFAASEPGVWYDPSDLTTLFQDNLGATPVTEAGQTVGLMLDKSGRGNNATQATLAQRPTYQVDGTGRPYLSFDGVDDGMVTGTITPATDKVQVFAGVRKLSDSAIKYIVELSLQVGANDGSFNLLAPSSSATPRYGFTSKGTIQSQPFTGGFTAPITNVVTGLGDISGDSAILRVNGIVKSTITTDQGTGNYLAYPLYIGRRGGTTGPFSGYLYSVIVRFGANLTDGQITSTESWVNGKTGAY